MSPDIRILDRNLEALLKRAYVPVVPHPDFRAELMRLARGEAGRRRGSGRGRLLRFVLPAAAAAAALVIWLATGLGGSGDEQLALTSGELVARGEVALRLDGGSGWRAATAEERTHGLPLQAHTHGIEAQTPASASIEVRADPPSPSGANSGEAKLQRSSRARFVALPHSAYGDAGPGTGAELLIGGMHIDLSVGGAAMVVAHRSRTALCRAGQLARHLP